MPDFKPDPCLFPTRILHKPYADQEPAIGETIGPAKQEGVEERQIGEAQAWYYHEDKILVLWGVLFMGVCQG